VSGESFHKRLYWSALQGWSALFVCSAWNRPAAGSGPQFAANGRMMDKRKRESTLARATRSFQENVSRSGPVAGASYALIGAILLLGGIGYVADRSFGTGPWGLVVGLTFGIIVGFYELAKTVWPR
jgi:F0F1-type ATP synthase assembly protein I